MKWQMWRLGAGIMMAGTLAGLAGCGVFEGVHVARGEEKSTAAYRFEPEYIPDAQLLRQDTSPYWLLGSYAFGRGADRLFVVSRITSWDDTPPDKREAGKPAVLTDHIVERVWVSIPMSVKVGEEIRIEDLQEKFLTGYDVDEGKGFFAQPNGLLGKITILEETPDHISVRVNMVVKPASSTDWVITKTAELTPTPDGVKAQKADMTRMGVTIPGGTAHRIQAPPPATAPSPTGVIPTETAPAAEGEPPATQPGAATEPAK